MKKFLLLATLCTVAMTMSAENTDISGMDNVVYIEPCTAEAGSEYTLSVKMKNTVVAESFGFDLVLPDGIAVALDEFGDPKAELSTERTNLNVTNHFDADFKLDGTLNIQAYSSKGRAISGNDGEVALITLKIADNMLLGTYPLQLKNIAVGDENSVTYTVDLVESSIEIVGGDGYTILDEKSTELPDEAEDVNVRVLRTIDANEWSTICLPFSMTEDQVKTAFGDGVTVELADADSYETTEDNGGNIVGIKIKFVNVTAIEANHPYIIKVSKPVTSFEAEGVDVAPAARERNRRKALGSGSYFVGNYVSQTVVPEFCLFLSGNQFWYSVGETEMKGFRGYFNLRDVLTDVEDSYSSRISFSFENETTGISEIVNSQSSNSKYYDLQGRRVAKPGKGLFVKDGRKVIIK